MGVTFGDLRSALQERHFYTPHVAWMLLKLDDEHAYSYARSHGFERWFDPRMGQQAVCWGHGGMWMSGSLNMVVVRACGRRRSRPLRCEGSPAQEFIGSCAALCGPSTLTTDDDLPLAVTHYDANREPPTPEAVERLARIASYIDAREVTP